jgi:hypothetical protein
MELKKFFGLARVETLQGVVTVDGDAELTFWTLRRASVAGVCAGAVAVAAAFLACVGADPPAPVPVDPRTVASDGGVPALDPDAAPSLYCPLNCLPPAIEGWTGPSAVYEGPYGSKPSSCPPLYTQKEIETHDDLLGAPPAECLCGSGTVQGASCIVKVESHLTKDCGGKAPDPQFVTIPGTACAAKDAGALALAAAPGVLDGGSCSFNVTRVFPEPSYGKAAIACQLPQFASCAERADCVATPIPAAPYTRLCIHRVGEQSCPSLDYAVRFVEYLSFTEGRTCTCTGTVAGSCANAPVYYSNGDCTGTAQPGGECGPGANSVSLAQMGPTNLSCVNVLTLGGAGGVTLKDPVTFCCNR